MNRETLKSAAEGLGKTIKRGMAGWSAFDKDNPADVVKRVKGQDTDTLKGLSRTGPAGKGSPAELQQKAISRELKKRGEQGVVEDQGSIVDKCASLAAEYFNSAGLQQQYDIDEFIKMAFQPRGWDKV